MSLLGIICIMLLFLIRQHCHSGIKKGFFLSRLLIKRAHTDEFQENGFKTKLSLRGVAKSLSVQSGWSEDMNNCKIATV